jgi:hypothetical protein
MSKKSQNEQARQNGSVFRFRESTLQRQNHPKKSSQIYWDTLQFLRLKFMHLHSSNARTYQLKSSFNRQICVSRGQVFVGDLLLPKPRSFVSHSIASAEKLPSRLEILTKQRTLTQAKLISKPEKSGRSPVFRNMEPCAFLMLLAQEWRSFALRTCSSQQRTLACCPPPAQVFSQQLPNQMQFFFFFQILKILNDFKS